MATESALQPKPVDLLVVNYNTREKLQRFLDTLHSDDDGYSWNLYVADNGSSDGSREWLGMNRYDYRIKQLYFNENIGYSRAINKMALHSGSEVLAAVNADVWMTTEDVKNVSLKFYDPTVAVVGPKQRDEQNRIRHAGIIGTNTAPKHRGWAELDEDDSKYRDVIDCVTVSGSAYFMSRRIWDEMIDCKHYQAFNTKYFGERVEGAFLQTKHFYEETHFSYHSRKHGYRVVYDGTVSCGHTWAASTNGPNSYLGEMFRQSKPIFQEACDMHGIEHD